jgi:SAM-dependent methyltransferase
MSTGNNQNTGAVMEKPKVSSRAWNWSLIAEDYWNDPSDEFLPVALRWREQGCKEILDLGCGKGRHALFLAMLGFNVTAVDLSPEGIEQLRAAAKQRGLDGSITTLVCDMLSIPFEDNSFDAVLGFHSLYHTDYVGLKTVVIKITRTLRESGRLYITFNSKSNPSFRAADNELVDSYTIIRHYGMEDGIPHTFLDYDDIITLLANYNILKIQQIQDYFDDLTSIHFFVEAEKNNR